MRDRLRLTSCVIATGLAAAMLASNALAQSCDPLVPVQNPTFVGSAAGQPINGAPWSTTTLTTGPGTTDGWVYNGGVAEHTDDYFASPIATSDWNSFQQTIVNGVSDESVIQFEVQWANSNSTAQEGSRVDLEVLYAGQIVARLTTPAVGAADNSKTVTALNSASIAVSPAWPGLAPSTWATVRVTLPAGAAHSGDLQFRSRRNNPTNPSVATDDLAIRNPVILSAAVCLVKQSNLGTGTFDFSVFNGDTDLGTPGLQGAASITTTVAGTAVAFDAWPGATGAAAGTTPMLIEEPDFPLEITETVPSGFVLDSVTCTGGGTATLSGATAEISGVAPAALPTVCTFINRVAQADLQVSATASPNPVAAGGVVTYQLTVTNAGEKEAVDATLTDVASVGQDCAVPATTASCTASGGATCPGGGTSGSIAVSALTGGGVTLPSVPVGGQVLVELQCQVTATGN